MWSRLSGAVTVRPHSEHQHWALVHPLTNERGPM
jgi:hypothetical protein